MATTQRFLCLYPVYEFITKGLQFPNWYGYLDYNSLLGKLPDDSPCRKYVIQNSYTEPGIEDIYKVAEIQTKDLVLVDSLETRLLYHKSCIYNTEQIKTFVGLSAATRSLYFQDKEDYYDLSVLRKRLKLIYTPIFIDIMIKIRKIQTIESSKARYRLNIVRIQLRYVKDNPFIEMNVHFKLDYAIAKLIKPALLIKPILKDGALQLIGRLCFFQPEYIPVVVFFENKKFNRWTLPECLNYINAHNGNLDIGVCYFIVNTFMGIACAPIDSLIYNALTTHHLYEAERKLNLFVTATAAGIETNKLDITNNRNSTEDLNLLFMMMGLVEDYDMIHDIDKVQLTSNAEIARTIDGVSYEPNWTVFRVLESINLNQSYSFYYAYFFCDVATALTRMIPTHTYTVVVPSVLKSDEFAVFKTIEEEIKTSLRTQLFSTDIRIATSATSGGYNFTIQTGDIVNTPGATSTVYDMIENGRNPILNLVEIQKPPTTLYICLNPFVNRTDFTPQSCNVKRRINLEYISNYTLKIFYNRLWLQTGLNEYALYDPQYDSIVDDTLGHYDKAIKEGLSYLQGITMTRLLTTNINAFEGYNPHGLYIYLEKTTFVPIQNPDPSIRIRIKKQVAEENLILYLILKDNTGGGHPDISVELIQIDE